MIEIDLSEAIVDAKRAYFDKNKWNSISSWHKEVLSRYENVREPIFLKFPDDITLTLPDADFGRISVIHLIGPHEISLFSEYFHHRNRSSEGTQRAVDCGANIGLHTCLLAKLGYDVISIEPDPATFEVLRRTCEMNGVAPSLKNCAIVSSNQKNPEKKMAFTRVIDNPTASGLSNSEKIFYGNTEIIYVPIISLKELAPVSNLLKIDIEGNELHLIRDIIESDIFSQNIIVELSNSTVAQKAHKILVGQNRYKWSTEKSHGKDNPDVSEFPESWREGSLHLELIARD